jgi:hypothetical protein
MDIDLTLIIIAGLVSLFLSIKLYFSNKSSTAEVLTLQQELNKAQNETHNYVTGGDSYPTLIFSDYTDTTTQINISNEGARYPLFDLEVTIANVTDLEFRKVLNMFGSADMFPGLREQLDDTALETYAIGNLPAGAITHLVEWKFPNNDGQWEINAFFSSRNGFYTGQYVVRRKESKWYRVGQLKNESGKIIWRESAPGFYADKEAEYVFPDPPAGQKFVGIPGGKRRTVLPKAVTKHH